MKHEHLKQIIQGEYRQAALQVKGGVSACCSAAAADPDPITSNHYSAQETAAVPTEALAVSLGCGNPTALAELQEGETVLDLGSGGGIDVLLSAKRVGPMGKVYGIDMTEEMVALARENQAKAGIHNVEFLRGEIENIPLPDNSVDVVISNCVVNLSPEKDRVLSEAFRVLRPGGRFAISDIVVRGPVPSTVRKSLELWAGCIAGALEEQEYEIKLRQVGFQAVSVQATRVYMLEDARAFLVGSGLDVDAVAREIEGRFMSAFVRGIKPTQT
jgi:arsenite methyltransferase